MFHSNLNISVKDNEFIVKSDDDNKDIKCIYYIKYDIVYEYMYTFIKENGDIDIWVDNSSLDYIGIEYNDKKYIFDDYMFKDNFDNDNEYIKYIKSTKEYNLGKDCFNFYLYYFHD